MVCARSIEAKCYVGYEDAVGAAATGDDPTTFEWSTIPLPTEVRFILEVLRYSLLWCKNDYAQSLNDYQITIIAVL